MNRTTLYILQTEKPKIYKIGISKHSALHRAKQVRSSAKMLVLPVLEVRLFTGAALETALHKALSRYNAPQRGSGKTEYFRLNFALYYLVRAAIFTIWLTELFLIAFFCLSIVFLVIFVLLRFVLICC
jgi:hypothetical protein